ncbi:MAG: hypothetical protein OHK0012_14670 [Synechococcales cyanobacterium]
MAVLLLLSLLLIFSIVPILFHTMSLTPYHPPRTTATSPALNHFPAWVGLSFLPVVGSFALIYAGIQVKLRTRSNGWLTYAVLMLLLTGLGFTVSALELLIPLALLGQISFAFLMRYNYLVYTAPRGAILPENARVAKLLARVHGLVDMNNASKDDLVHFLGIPIVYANIICEFQQEGITFQDLEELKNLTRIPGEYVDHLAPIITFGVRYQQELNQSWHRLNSLSAPELVSWGLDEQVAARVVQDRQQRGAFQSVMDVKQRTGIPLSALRDIL